MKQMTEEQLLEEIRSQNPLALEEAIARYGGLVYVVIQRSMGTAFTPEDGEELSSDVFLALWGQRDPIQPGKLKSWLGAVARNKARSACRKRRTLVPLDSVEVAVDNPLWETLAEAERREAVRRTVNALPQEDKKLITGYYYYEKPIKELARELGISSSAAKVRLYRLRNKLKGLFEERGIN